MLVDPLRSHVNSEFVQILPEISMIKNTINEGILKLIIDVSSLEEVEEDAIEVVGEFAEKIEDMKLPMRGAIIATGEDAEMWNNLDGCEEWGVCEDIDSAKEYLAKDPDSDGDE